MKTAYLLGVVSAISEISEVDFKDFPKEVLDTLDRMQQHTNMYDTDVVMAMNIYERHADILAPLRSPKVSPTERSLKEDEVSKRIAQRRSKSSDGYAQSCEEVRDLVLEFTDEVSNKSDSDKKIEATVLAQEITLRVIELNKEEEVLVASRLSDEEPKAKFIKHRRSIPSSISKIIKKITRF